MNQLKPRRSKLKTVVRLFLMALTLLVLAVAIVGSTLYFNKDEINKRILNYLNSLTYGDLQYIDLELNPFSQFPSVSMTMSGVSFKLDQDSISDDSLMLQIDKMHLAFNIREIVEGNVKITKIKLEEGSIYLKQYEDGTFNITKAIKLRKEASVTPENDSVTQASTLALKQVSFKNIALNLETKSADSLQEISINTADFSLDYNKDSLACSLETKLVIKRGVQLASFDFTNDAVEFKTHFSFDKNKGQLKIDVGELNIRSSSLQIIGAVDLKNHEVDLEFKSSEKGLGLANQLLTSKGIDNIKQGDFYLEGNVRGAITKPDVDVSFGVNDVKIKIPESQRFIQEVNLSGTYKSGSSLDRSDAKLTIDTLYAQLPDGHIRASFIYKNFLKPSLNYCLDIETSLNNLDQVFELGPLTNLEGKISFKDKFSGKKMQNEWIDRSTGKLSAKLDSISLNLFDSVQIDLIDGKITGSIDSIKIEELFVLFNDTDVMVSGNINHLRDIFFVGGRDVGSDLYIISKRLNVKTLTAFIPEIDDKFHHEIKDLSLDIDFKSNYKTSAHTHEDLTIDLDIKSLNAEVPESIPGFKISNATVIYRYTDSITFSQVSNLLFDFGEASGNLNLGIFDFKERLNDSLHAKLDFKNLDLGKFKKAISTDSKSISGRLDGNFNLQLKQSAKSGEKLSSIVLKTDSLFYRDTKDTVRLNLLNLYADDIYYAKEGNLLASLSADLKININDLRSSWINKPSLSYDVSINQGAYEIIPVESSISGKTGQGKYTLNPFVNPPKFKFDYSVEQYAIEDFIGPFYDQDTLSNRITGLADLTLSIETSGNNKEEIFKNLNGKVDLMGEDLTVYGFDFDRAIRKYERTQKFNLLDFGAFALTGPIGAAITKSNSYAGLLKIKKGDSTAINRLSSRWIIEGGRCSIKDVALATNENRLAGEGWIDFDTDSLEFQVAALDKNGCPIISQQISGDRRNPNLDGVKVIPTILAPITNLFTGIIGKDCEVFYDGEIKHPEKAKRKKKRK